MLQLVAGLVQDVAERHRREFQMRLQTLEVCFGQHRKQMILSRPGIIGHGNALGSGAILDPIQWLLGSLPHI